MIQHAKSNDNREGSGTKKQPTAIVVNTSLILLEKKTFDNVI
jgi:hypothetical protein